jgi:outer membrane protein assembly factor BamB
MVCMAMPLFPGAAAAVAEPAPDGDDALAQVRLSGEAQRTARRLAVADRLVSQGRWNEAIDEYGRIVDETGDDLVPVDAYLSMAARRLCQVRMAALPADALKLYRARVDSQAKQWLDAGIASRDVSILSRLVREAFASSHTDRALDLLGDLAFERGSFDEAERYWRMLASPASQIGTSNELVFPDPRLDPAQARAKQILAQLFRGDRNVCFKEMEAFRLVHAKAIGHLAGEDGSLVRILEGLLTNPGSIAPPEGRDSWSTFAGSGTRNFVLPRPGECLTRLPRNDGPLWRRRLDTGESVPTLIQEPLSNAPAHAARSLAFYPVIAGERVFVADARSVSGYDLPSGKRVFHYDVSATGEGPGLSGKLPASAGTSFTLSIAEDRLYARLGSQGVEPRKSENNDSYLFCLSVDGTPRAKPERWRVKAPVAANSPGFFEGAPAVRGDLAVVAVTQVVLGRKLTSLACYDAQTGGLRWQRDVCETLPPRDEADAVRTRLVTLAGGQVIYCSHSGAIVALDAVSGERLWARRYPSRNASRQSGVAAAPRVSPRILTPCLAAGRRIYTAPEDLDRILCLDLETGNLLWESAPLEVVHLLGVARGRLIFTESVPTNTTVPLQRIRAIDSATGNGIRHWVQPADGGGLTTFGRGLLAGEYVYWPTARGLRVLTQEDGEPVLEDQLIRGNLAAANGYLVVADTETLSAYVPEARLLQGRPDGYSPAFQPAPINRIRK